MKYNSGPDNRDADPGYRLPGDDGGARPYHPLGTQHLPDCEVHSPINTGAEKIFATYLKNICNLSLKYLQLCLKIFAAYLQNICNLSKKYLQRIPWKYLWSSIEVSVFAAALISLVSARHTTNQINHKYRIPAAEDFKFLKPQISSSCGRMKSSPAVRLYFLAASSWGRDRVCYSAVND